MRILVTGSSGFIGGYLVSELLEAGHDVVGIDNFSKYGPVKRSHDDHPRFRFVEGDCKNVDLLRSLVADVDVVVAGAAMIGGISYFHRLAYDLVAENERILASTFDAAIEAWVKGRLQKVVVLSSSMVFECTESFPSREEDLPTSPPPRSSYGFQKLSCEVFARAARDQYGLPFTICRPFNCVGVGEGRARTDIVVTSGNVRLAMSHVLPDLAQKCLKGQYPLRILGDGSQVRCYTHGTDLARGIRACIESPAALNEDFNLSTPRETTVLELAEIVFRTARPGEEFAWVSDPPFEHDVRRRVPSTEKAKRLLGFEAVVPLERSVREVVDWVARELAAGTI